MSIEAFYGHVPIYCIQYSTDDEKRKKKMEKNLTKKNENGKKMRKNECAALFFDMMLFMPKNIGRTSWLPWWWLVRVCVRPCSIVTCYMNRIRAWSERMERKKQQQQQKTPLFILYLWVLCVHWWWVCRAFNASTGYLCVNSVEFVYNWRNREKKKKCRKINISIQIHRYAKFTSRMFSVCTPYMWPEVFHRMMDVPKCSAKWKYSRGKKREKFVIAFVFRWKSTPHFISMNIFLYFSFFFTYFLFNLFFLPSLHRMYVRIYDDYIFGAFDATENNRNWEICTRFYNKS